jgi:hypothetical protein
MNNIIHVKGYFIKVRHVAHSESDNVFLIIIKTFNITKHTNVGVFPSTENEKRKNKTSFTP